MKLLSFCLAVLNAICLIILLLFTSVSLPTFYTGFYSHAYDKYGIPESIGVSKDDLMIVTRHMLDYMLDKKPDLVVVTQVAGEQREFFNDREKSHMIDVKNLFLAGHTLARSALLGFIASILALFLLRPKRLRVLPLCYAIVLPLFLVGAGILAWLIASDFDSAFHTFHVLFFTNDLWLLDPRTDLLVNIVPSGFFMDISMTIGILFIGSILIAAFVSGIYLISRRNQKSR